MSDIQNTIDAASEKALAQLETMARDLIRDNPTITGLTAAMGHDSITCDGDESGFDSLDSLDAKGLAAAQAYQAAHDAYFEAFGSPGFVFTRKDASPAYVEPTPVTFESFAADMGLTMTARHVNNRPDVAGDDWQATAIHFHITIEKPDTTPGFKAQRPPVVVWAGFYSVGAAWPEMWARDGCKLPPHSVAALMPSRGNRRETYHTAARAAYAKLDHKTKARGTVHDSRHWDLIESSFKRAAPLSIGSILESLQCDSRDWESTFEDWASDCGYDTDSRKAESIFRACQDTAKTIRRAFGADVFNNFLEIEE